MKKVVMFCCIIYATLLCATAQNSEIHFENDSLAILCTKAKKENKLIFIDAYTSWCGPCKWMAANIFPNDTVGTFYNANFVNVQIDMEHGEGPDIAKRYEIWCYPTFLFIDETGTLLHRKSGGCTAPEFISLGKDAMNPKKQYCIMEKKYESGTATTLEFIHYMVMRRATCLQTDEQITSYVDTQNETDLSNRNNWTILNNFITDPHSKMFQYLLSHREEFDTKYTTDSVTKIINRVYGTALSRYFWVQVPDTAGYKKLRNEIVALHQPALDMTMLGGDIQFYTVIKDWNNYAKTAIMYIEKYAAKDDYMLLNNIAWGFYENINNKAYLDKAILWAKKSVEIYPAYFNTDTYAAVLYKRGKYKEALVQAKIAIQLGKDEGADYSETEKLMEKIEAAIKP